MNWQEEQRVKMTEDLNAGRITVEQYNEMNSALDKTYGNKARGGAKNIPRSVKLSILILAVFISCFFVWRISVAHYFNKGSNVQARSGGNDKTNADQSLDQIMSERSPLMYTDDYEFIELCKKGSSQQINDALAYGASANAKDKGMTPLMAAASENPDQSAIKILIDQGADINYKNVSGNTPLMLAVGNNSNPEVTKALIEAGSDVNVKDINGATPLMLAASNNSNPEAIAALIEAGADVNAANVLERTPLLLATGNNSNPEITSALIKAGANVNAKDADGKTPLILAATSKTINLGMITDLINAGADVNARDKFGLTPLMLAAGNENSNSEVITAIVKAGVNVNTPDEDGKTPLMEAARINSNLEVINTLLSLGANQTLKDDAGKTAINYARENNGVEDADTLRKLQSKEYSAAGAKNPARPAMSDYKFLELCRKSTAKQISDAITKGANVKAKNGTGMTSLMFAARDNPNPEAMTTLVKAGADINAKDVKGATPLMFAIGNNLVQQVIMTLLQLGADPDVEDNSGKKAVDYSAANRVNAIRNILGLSTPQYVERPKNVNVKSATISKEDSINFLGICKRGASAQQLHEEIKNGRVDVNITDSMGTTPLLAVVKGSNVNSEMIRILLREGAFINMSDKNGNNPLMMAAANNSINPEVIETLLSYGANINAKNRAGKKAIDFARNNSKLKNSDLLWKLDRMSR